MSLSRRDFMRSIASFGAGLGVCGGTMGLSELLAASSALGGPDMHYVFCYFGGGWDVLLGLDPRDPSVFHSGNRSVTRLETGYELLDIPGDTLIEPVPGMTLGPFIGEMANLAPQMTVVRGMSMETLTHATGRRRFLTGRPPSGINARGSSTDAWLASRLGAANPIPNLAFNMESYNKDHPAWASALRTNSISDLTRALFPGSISLGEVHEAALEELLRETALCPQAVRSPVWQAAESNRINARALVSSGLGDLFDFQASTSAMAALRARYVIPATGRLNSSAVAAATAATAIMNGVSRCVSVRVAAGLDTHYANWQTDHGEQQLEGFNAVARLAEDLKATPYGDTSESWLDHTVIIGFSEFSRTPLLNANGGRDHWLMNACFLLGGNIKGGQVIGASSNVGMNPTPVDLQTGAPLGVEDGGVVVRPEHILQALYEEIGLTTEPDLRVSPLNAVFGSL